ncbi:sulfotransferase family protein [Agrobacterium tumefaciens]|uniref:PIN-like domain-containing protein n=1 Tax=Agrobacterium tumefaciens TaxID=358 RepID=UPI000B718368|nr:PIN-like domain-containing protein [Agrobacterium tumefaciens]OVE86825.1 sulfotransferase family protein [Agrobacterium tumefaciens]
MRDKYPGWYPKSSVEASALWDNAIFVPDANVLLHCLRHPAAVREELLRLFDALKESLWIPYQVGLEFHRNRLDVELGAQDAYDILIKDQEATIEKARERLRQLRAHPTISVPKELAALDMFSADFRARMAASQASHPTEDIAAAVTRLTQLLAGRIGDKWKPEQLAALKKEGEDRYTKKIPPGYKDAKKDAGEFDKYGDLIIWKDMIGKAKADKRPVIFISDDAKEDWWWIHKGRKLGPRPELIEEFQAGSDQDFHIYEFAQFLRFAGERFPEIKAGVDQVEKSLQDDARARKKQNEAAEAIEIRAKVRELEDERDQIVAALSGAPGAAISVATADRAALRARLGELTAELESHQPSLGTSSATSDGSDVVGTQEEAP